MKKKARGGILNKAQKKINLVRMAKSMARYLKKPGRTGLPY
jgi:hypothetical protein